jgi:beta-glucanase (GH16 family)
MWPFSAPSEHAVLSLNSTRPSNRRRRRPRLELQLERLEDRQLLSAPTSSSPVLFQDTFSSNTPSSAWSFVGGTWKINNGVLSQTSTAAADPKKAMITNQTFPSNLMITSEVQVNSWNAGDMARAGVGLYTNPSNGNGYNLVFHDTNQVQFLDDKVTWGNAYTFNWQVGTWYWFQLAENNGTLEGKVWAAGTAEPQSWMFQQTGWTNLTGGAPALNGGSASASGGSSTVSFASVSVTTTSVQPDTANAGSAFAATPGSAVTFSQATATGTGPLTYAWNFGNGGTATGTLNPTYTYQSAGTFTAQLTVTDALGIPAMSSVTVTVNPTTPPLPSPIAGTNYQLAWSDDFPGTSIDASKWEDVGPWGHPCGSSLAGFNYSPSNVSVANGVATITAQESGGIWTGGILCTDTTKTFQYGYFQVSAKLPAGQGFWPGIWLCHTNAEAAATGTLGELDIMEAIGGGNTAYQTVHTDSGQIYQAQTTSANFTTGYNTYGLLWTPTSVSYYINGVQTGSWNVAIPDQMWLALNFDVAGPNDWGGGTNSSTPTTAQFDINSVQVYQLT